MRTCEKCGKAKHLGEMAWTRNPKEGLHRGKICLICKPLPIVSCATCGAPVENNNGKVVWCKPCGLRRATKQRAALRHRREDIPRTGRGADSGAIGGQWSANKRDDDATAAMERILRFEDNSGIRLFETPDGKPDDKAWLAHLDKTVGAV